MAAAVSMSKAKALGFERVIGLEPAKLIILWFQFSEKLSPRSRLCLDLPALIRVCGTPCLWMGGGKGGGGGGWEDGGMEGAVMDGVRTSIWA